MGEKIKIERPFVAGYLIYKVFRIKNYRTFYALRELLREMYDLSPYTTAMISDGFYILPRLAVRKDCAWVEEWAEEYLATEEGKRFEELLKNLKNDLFCSLRGRRDEEALIKEINKRAIEAYRVR
jgi:hypothetical protein